MNIIISVTGKTILSVAVARSRYSNCPDRREIRPAAIPPSPPPVFAFHLRRTSDRARVSPRRSSWKGAHFHFLASVGLPSRRYRPVPPAPPATAGGYYRQHPQRVDVITQIAGITQVDGIPLASPDHLTNVIAPDQRGDRALQFIDGNAVARGFCRSIRIST